MNKRYIFIFIALLVFQTVCFATEKGSGEVFTRLGSEKKIASGLDLTEEQRKEIFSKKSQMEKEVAALKKRIIELKNLIKTELGKDLPDRGNLHGYIIEMNNAQSQIQIKRVDFIVKKRELLSPEQKEKYRKMFLGEKEEPFFSPAGE